MTENKLVIEIDNKTANELHYIFGVISSEEINKTEISNQI